MRLFSLITTSLLTLPIHALAETNSVQCPNLEVIRQSANLLNEATYVNSAYIANTPPFAIHSNHTDWFAVVYDIHTSSSKEALVIARQLMLSADFQDNLFARNLGGIYKCNYNHGKIMLLSNEREDEFMFLRQTAQKIS